ncbi:hypothetical protein [Natronorubrum bangense]|uniref:hypothetical protein n=1 Tax=Natronorubrum bangense TaxID=61858 RepID=UPI001F116702|nr:hypothetical protein [Natronorubrum bangense]
MTSELQLDFDVDPEIQVERFPKIVREEYPSARIRHVEEILVANDGPVDYLGGLPSKGTRNTVSFTKTTIPIERRSAG